MSSDANKKSGDSEAIGRIYWHRSTPAVPYGQCAPPAATIAKRVDRACLSVRKTGGTVARFRARPMQVRLEPQGKQLTIAGRRRVGDLVQSLGIIAGTVMVIRGDELLTDDEFVDDADTIELRAVISGGAA
jgi:sulfur carrier protein